jgi:DNA adenine methylase
LRYNSPLRYPGGKSALVDFIKEIFRENGLCDGAYAEPYAGGASVALSLLFEELASKIYINDADPAVHAFWFSVVNDNEGLCRLVRDTKPTLREWDRQRSIYAEGGRASKLQLGFSAFFLNRTNRSGIIASAGVIGGRKQDGNWKIDARYNRPELASRIERIGQYRDRIEVSNYDAAVFLSQAAKLMPAKSLLYLDPPYFVKGERRLYANYYEARDHAAIAKRVQKLVRNWLVSYDHVPEIRALYSQRRSLTYPLRYSASSAREGDEVMFFSDGLIIPKKSRPVFARCLQPKLSGKAA